MLRLVCMFLGCDMPIQLVLSSENKTIMIDYKIRFIIYGLRHELQNMQHFMLEQIDLHIFLPVIYQ